MVFFFCLKNNSGLFGNLPSSINKENPSEYVETRVAKSHIILKGANFSSPVSSSVRKRELNLVVENLICL